MTDKIKQIAEHYGLEKQLDQTVEELSELILAIQKYKRKNQSQDLLFEILQEIADVEIMTEQLTLLFETETTASQFIKYTKLQKLDRQLRRISDER